MEWFWINWFSRSWRVRSPPGPSRNIWSGGSRGLRMTRNYVPRCNARLDCTSYRILSWYMRQYPEKEKVLMIEIHKSKFHLPPHLSMITLKHYQHQVVEGEYVRLYVIWNLLLTSKLCNFSLRLKSTVYDNSLKTQAYYELRNI